MGGGLLLLKRKKSPAFNTNSIPLIGLKPRAFKVSAIGTIRKDIPQGGSDFLRYFERLIEAEALKKLLGGK